MKVNSEYVEKKSDVFVLDIHRSHYMAGVIGL